MATAAAIPCADSLLDTNSSPVDKDDLRKEVASVLDKLPRQFRKRLHNLEVVIEERPGEELFSRPDSTPNKTRFTDSTKAFHCPIAPAFTHPFYQTKLQFSRSLCCETFPTRPSCASKFARPCCTRSPTTLDLTMMKSTSWEY